MIDSLRQLHLPAPGKATVVDVSARDGLQAVEATLAPGARAAWIRRLFEAGVPEVEAGSFVHPGRVPQMVGAGRVLSDLRGFAERLWFLVPNRQGLRTAHEAGARQVVCVVSATERHSRSNLGRSIGNVLAELEIQAAEAATWGLRTRAAISMAWADPDEGEVSVDRIVGIAIALKDFGFEEITLCDTYGRAGPRQVWERVRDLGDIYPPRKIGLHLHDAVGLAAAGVFAGVLAGVRRFDASLAGLGGCPFAAGSRGNLDLDTAVRVLEDADLATGIDLAAVTAARETNLAVLSQALQLDH